MAFREQTAGHNALLLLVALSHDLLEARLRNAFLDVDARAAEVDPALCFRPRLTCAAAAVPANACTPLQQGTSECRPVVRSVL